MLYKSVNISVNAHQIRSCRVSPLIRSLKKHLLLPHFSVKLERSHQFIGASVKAIIVMIKYRNCQQQNSSFI